MPRPRPKARSLKGIRKLPWLSLGLMLVAYASFGWFLSEPDFPTWGPVTVPLALAFVWIWIVSLAFMSPLTSFSRFVTHSFKSDTVAFLSVFMMAALATFILFWMQIFLYMLTILATESLVRIDVQTRGYAEFQAFWILSVVSLVGLTVGWGVRWLPECCQALWQPGLWG